MVRAKRICNLSLGIETQAWTPLGQGRPSQNPGGVYLLSERVFSSEGKIWTEASKPDILLESPYSETLGVTPCSFHPLEGNVKGVAQGFPSLGFCVRSQSVTRSAL